MGNSFDLDKIMEGIFIKSVDYTKQVGSATTLDAKYTLKDQQKGPELERTFKRTNFKFPHVGSKTKTKQLPSTKRLIGNNTDSGPIKVRSGPNVRKAHQIPSIIVGSQAVVWLYD